MKKYFRRVLGPQKPVDQEPSQETSPLFPKKALNSYQLKGGINILRLNTFFIWQFH